MAATSPPLQDSVEVFKNGTSFAGPWGPNEPNGFRFLTGLSIANGDLIKVMAEDADGNRQFYEKTGEQLKSECQWKFKIVQADPIPVP